MPRPINDMQSLYTEGKYFIFRNIPYPSINVFEKFIYISLSEMCIDLFGFGYDVGVVSCAMKYFEFYNASKRTSVYQGSFGKA